MTVVVAETNKVQVALLRIFALLTSPLARNAALMLVFVLDFDRWHAV